MGRRTDIDWAAVRRDFEADLMTDTEVAELHKVNRTSMYRKAKAQGWQKNQAARVAERTQAKLVTATVAGSGQGPAKRQSDNNATVAQAGPGRTEPTLARCSTIPQEPAEDPVEVAASVNVQVIMGHRATIARAQILTGRLFDEAEAQFEDAKLLPVLAKADITVDGKPLPAGERAKLATALARARDLPTRASTLKTLSEALRLQVGLERQAFGIDKDAGGEDPNAQGDFRQRLLNARKRALDARSPS